MSSPNPSDRWIPGFQASHPALKGMFSGDNFKKRFHFKMIYSNKSSHCKLDECIGFSNWFIEISLRFRALVDLPR